MNIKETSQKYNLDWEVAVEPLTLADGTPTSFNAVVRQDNRDTFACVKKYQPFQNHDLLRLGYALSEESHLDVGKVISIDGGRKIMLQLRNKPIENIGKNNDTIEQYITVLNSHDGTSKLRWGLTNTTLSCKNQFFTIGKNMQSVRHTKNMMAQAHNMIDELNAMKEVQALQEEVLRELTYIPADKNKIDDFLYSMTGCDDDSHGKTLRKHDELYSAIRGEMAYKGENLWALFEGATYHSTHQGTREKTREVSKIQGSLNKWDQKALQTVKRMMLQHV